VEATRAWRDSALLWILPHSELEATIDRMASSSRARTVELTYYLAEFLLGEYWSGVGWNMESPVDRTSAALDILRAISCSSATRCTTVGESLNTVPFGPSETLAEELLQF
jgi:hypothetical protein